MAAKSTIRRQLLARGQDAVARAKDLNGANRVPGEKVDHTVAPGGVEVISISRPRSIWPRMLLLSAPPTFVPGGGTVTGLPGSNTGIGVPTVTDGVVNDRFRTENHFYGVNLGLAAEVRRGAWFQNLAVLLKVAFILVFCGFAFPRLAPEAEFCRRAGAGEIETVFIRAPIIRRIGPRDL